MYIAFDLHAADVCFALFKLYQAILLMKFCTRSLLRPNLVACKMIVRALLVKCPSVEKKASSVADHVFQQNDPSYFCSASNILTVENSVDNNISQSQ